MAEKIREYYDEETGQNLIEYDTGLIRNADTGRVVKPGTSQMITTENASAYQRRRKELSRQMVREVAGKHVEAQKYTLERGDLAYKAAIIEKVMDKAMRPSDPKQVEAAKFIISQAGDDDSEDKQGDDDTTIKGVLRDVADIARAMTQNTPMRSNISIDK